MPSGHPQPSTSREDFEKIDPEEIHETNEKRSAELTRKEKALNSTWKWLRKGPRAFMLALTDPRFRRHLNVRKAVYTTLTLGMFAVGGNKTHAQEKTRIPNPGNGTQLALHRTSDSGSYRVIAESKETPEKKNGKLPKEIKNMDLPVPAPKQSPVSISSLQKKKEKPKKPNGNISVEELVPVIPPESTETNIWNVLDDLELHIQHEDIPEDEDLEETRAGDELLPELTNPETGQLQIDWEKLSIDTFTIDKSQADWPVMAALKYGKRILLRAGAAIDELRPTEEYVEYMNEEYERSDLAEDIAHGLIDFFTPQLRISNGVEFRHGWKSSVQLIGNRRDTPQLTRFGAELRYRFKLRLDTPNIKDIRSKLFVKQDLLPGMTANIIYRNEWNPEENLRHEVAVGLNYQIAPNIGFSIEAIQTKDGEQRLVAGLNIVDMIGNQFEEEQEIQHALDIYPEESGSKTENRWDKSVNLKRGLRSVVKKGQKNGARANGGR